MDLQLFERHAETLAHVIGQLLPRIDGADLDAEIDAATLRALQTLQAHGPGAAVRELARLCRLGDDPDEDPGEALAAALASGPRTEAADELAQAVRREFPSGLQLVATRTPPGAAAPARPLDAVTPTGADVRPLRRSAREQIAEFTRFVLDESDPEVVLLAAAAQLARAPQLRARLLAAGVRPELLHRLEEYAALAPAQGGGFDAMVSYCNHDREEVLLLWRALEARALRVWIDHRDILPGAPVVETLCRIIDMIDKYVFCCGKDLGCWQDLEMQQMMHRLVTAPGAVRLIPVILASVTVDTAAALPRPLINCSALDLRNRSQAEALDLLEQAIRA